MPMETFNPELLHQDLLGHWKLPEKYKETKNLSKI